jgi:hypothetical protein
MHCLETKRNKKTDFKNADTFVQAESPNFLPGGPSDVITEQFHPGIGLAKCCLQKYYTLHPTF